MSTLTNKYCKMGVRKRTFLKSWLVKACRNWGHSKKGCWTLAFNLSKKDSPKNTLLKIFQMFYESLKKISSKSFENMQLKFSKKAGERGIFLWEFQPLSHLRFFPQEIKTYVCNFHPILKHSHNCHCLVSILFCKAKDYTLTLPLSLWLLEYLIDSTLKRKHIRHQIYMLNLFQAKEKFHLFFELI